MKGKPLAGKVAIVAGATRGTGRGIARGLGEKGATVYCTGRSVQGATPPGRPETIEETAEWVARSGGKGIAVQTDHLQPQEVQSLVDRVMADEGRIDILVNDIWGGDPLTEWGKPFWQLDPGKGFRLLETAIHTHIITSRIVVPHMVKARQGLVVEVTDGDSWAYRGNLFYDLAKATVARLAFGMSEELTREGVTSLAVTPGFLRSEAMLDHFGVGEHDWQFAGQQDPDFLESESPVFVGRCIAALAADPGVKDMAGRVWPSWDLAPRYDIVDIDGRRPDWGRHARQKYGSPPRAADDGFYWYLEGWQRLRDQLE